MLDLLVTSSSDVAVELDVVVPTLRTGPNAMDLSVLTWLGFSGAGGGREAVLVTECDVVPGAVVARAWR